MVELANLQVVVGIDSTAAERGLDALGTKVGGVGSAIQTALGAAAVGAVVGLGAAFVGSVKTAADFEKGLSAISAVSGATKEELEGIRQTALQLGKDTSFSAVEAAAGMEEMIKAGVSLTDTMNGGARAALDLAAAGGTSVPEAAAIMSNAMNTFRDDMLSAGETANIITGAANASAISVTDFGFSLSAVGAIAAQVGLPLKDTAVAIAVLGQNGLKGADAGTSLKAMLNGLVPATDKAQAKFNELGLETFNVQAAMDLLRSKGIKPVSEEAGALSHQIQTQISGIEDYSKATQKQRDAHMETMRTSGALKNAFFDETGAVKGSADIAEILKNALGDLSQEQQLLNLRTLFGTDGQRAASLMMKEGRAGVEAMTEAMAKQGDARRIADERLNNLSGSIEKLKGSLETGAVIFGSMFTPALKGMADAATENVNTAIEIIEQLPDAWRTAGQAFEGAWEPSDTLTPFMNMIGKMGLQLRELFGPTVQAALKGDLAGTLSGLGTAFGKLGEMMGTWISEQVAKIPWGDIWRAVKLTAQMIMNGISSAVGALDAQLTPWINAQIAAIDWAGVGTAFGESLVGAAQTGMDEAVGSGAATFDAAAFDAALTAFLIGVVTGAWTKTLENWRAQAPGAGYQKVFVDGLDRAGWVGAVHDIGDALTAEWNANRQKDYDNFQTWNTEKTAALNTWATETKTAVQTWNTETNALIATWGAEQVTAFQTWNTDTTLVITTWVTDRLAEFNQWNTDTNAVIKTWATDTVAAIQTWNTDTTATFTTWAADTWKILSDNWDAIWARTGEALDAVHAVVAEKFGAITNFFTTTVPEWVAAGAAMGTGLVTAVGDALKALAETVLGPIRRAVETVRGMLNFGGGGGGTGATNLSYTGSPDSESKLQRAYQIALSKGFTQDQANAMLGTLRVEGGLQGAVGDSGRSHGPFQLFKGGQLPNFDAWLKQKGIAGDPRQLANDIELATDFALDNYYGRALRAGTAAGLTGPALATHAQRTGQVSINPEKAGGAYGPPAGGQTPLNQMQRIPLGGPGSDPSHWPVLINEIIDVAPDWQTAMAEIKRSGVDTYGSVVDAAVTGGAALVTSSTDSLGNVTRIYSDATGVIGATMTSATGQIVNTWGTMATGVTEQSATMSAGVLANTNLMSNGALTSVTNLGSGILTSVTDSAGTTIATVTDMQGQVTSQYATLANGAVLTMGDMASGVLTSTTSLGDGVMTTVQDMAGNYVTTVTDLSGNVTSQYTQLGSEVAATTATMSTDVTAETAGMSTDVVANVTTMAANSEAAAVLMAEQIIAEAQSMARDTGIAADTMVSDVGEALQGLDVPVTVATELMQSVGDVEIEAPDVSDVIDAMKDVQKAAEKALKSIKDINSAEKGGSKGGKSGLGKGEKGDGWGDEKAAGGWTIPGLSTLVGEHGPEVVSTDRPMYVTPNHQLGSGGGATETHVFVVRDPSGRTLEEWYVTGQNLAAGRGRTS